GVYGQVSVRHVRPFGMNGDGGADAVGHDHLKGNALRLRIKKIYLPALFVCIIGQWLQFPKLLPYRSERTACAKAAVRPELRRGNLHLPHLRRTAGAVKIIYGIYGHVLPRLMSVFAEPELQR